MPSKTIGLGKQRSVDWERLPAISCIICSFPRTGSSLLSYGLDDTGLAGHPAEYFGPLAEARFAKKWDLPPHYSLRAYLRSMAREAMTENGVTSVKLFLPYLSHLMHRARAEFGADFDENGLIEECFPNPRYIFLRRRDRIRQAISFMRAMNTTEFERKTAYPVASTECYAGSTDGNLGGFLHDADDRIRHAAPGADPEPAMEKISSYVEAFTSQELQWRSFFKRNQVTAHEIVYEDLAADYQTTVLGALKFLGISPPPGLRLPPPRTVRQSDDATEKMAARYDEYKVRVQAEAADQSVTGTGSNHSGSFA